MFVFPERDLRPLCNGTLLIALIIFTVFGFRSEELMLNYSAPIKNFDKGTWSYASNMVSVMCNGQGTTFKADGFFSSVLNFLGVRRDSAIVGFEVWTPDSLLDFKRAISQHSRPHASSNISVVGLPLLYRPKIFVANNPENPTLLSRLEERMKWIGQKYEYISFGSLDDIVVRNDWIRTYVSKGNVFKKVGHELATLTAYQFIYFLSASPLIEALFLETDAVPVHGFVEKYTTFLQQLHSVMPDFDLAFLGTCLNMENGVPEQNRIAPNVLKSRTTRCFNAVLMSAAGARKVIKFGPAPSTSLFAIDHIMNGLISQIPLKVAWADRPLFYEESKMRSKHYCDTK